MALIASMYKIQYNMVHNNKDELMCSSQKLI